jgi:hypothetical protein
MITLAAGVLERSFEQLRHCGGARRECVVLWTGPLAQPGLIDDVVHPAHTASAVGYDIDPAWIGQLWLELAKHARTVRAQVHTHPSSAYHSSQDDAHALVHTPRYLSLVIPDFASGPISLVDAFLTERGSDGSWHELDPQAAIQAAP